MQHDFSPADARALLDAMQETQDLEEAELAYITLTAMRLSIGYPWRGPGEPTEEYQRHSARSRRMAQLHEQTVTMEAHGQDATGPRAEREKLWDEIVSEVLADLAEKGLPEAWKPKPNR